MLSEELENMVCSFIQKEINIENSIALYQFIRSPKFSKLCKRYIDCSFLMVAESKNFLQLSYDAVLKILSSSQLNITSEIEVFRSADKWISYDFVDRIKYAKLLLSKVRLHLLPNEALDYVLNELSTFRQSIECIFIIRDILKDKQSYRKNNEFSHDNDTRICNQSMFDIVAYDKYDSSSFKAFQCNHFTEEFIKLKDLNQMNDHYHHFNVCFYKGHIYACIILAHESQMKFAKYCIKSNDWETLSEFNGLVLYRMSFCVFIDKLYLLGGYVFREAKDCSAFDTVNNDLKTLKSMNEARCSAACTVFKERIIISGGHGNEIEQLTSVEAYNHVADRWSSMPNMVEGRFRHVLFAAQNKLFAIGGMESASCEVYDSRSKVFVLLKSPKGVLSFDFKNAAGAFCYRNKILVYQSNSPTIAFYDIEKQEWCEETYKSGGFEKFSEYLFIPQF